MSDMRSRSGSIASESSLASAMSGIEESHSKTSRRRKRNKKLREAASSPEEGSTAKKLALQRSAEKADLLVSEPAHQFETPPTVTTAAAAVETADVPTDACENTARPEDDSAVALDTAPDTTPAAPAVDNAVAPTVVPAAIAVAPAAVAAATPAVAQCPAWSIVAGGTPAVIAELSDVREAILDAILSAGVAPKVAKKILAATKRLDELALSLAMRNAVLESTESIKMPPPVAPARLQAAQVAPKSGPRINKPVETWSAVVKSRDPKMSGKEVAAKVMKEVAPALGVRVHEVRELKKGGAVIRTPSAVEINKVITNKSFTEVGVEIQSNKGVKSRVTVFDVDTCMTPAEFIEELYVNNFKEDFSPAAFSKAVHMETKPWSVADGVRINLTLEVDEKALAILEKTGRVYIKWFSYRCRSLVRTYACHRCVGFDHMVSQCRCKSEVCRQCGQEGHIAAKCTSPVDCRNCRFRGLPSGHYMLSGGCPIYGAVLARVQAKH